MATYITCLLVDTYWDSQWRHSWHDAFFVLTCKHRVDATRTRRVLNSEGSVDLATTHIKINFKQCVDTYQNTAWNPLHKHYNRKIVNMINVEIYYEYNTAASTYRWQIFQLHPFLAVSANGHVTEIQHRFIVRCAILRWITSIDKQVGILPFRKAKKVKSLIGTRELNTQVASYHARLLLSNLFLRIL